jgi:transcriptional regulator with XRE-family HTH domain
MVKKLLVVAKSVRIKQNLTFQNLADKMKELGFKASKEVLNMYLNGKTKLSIEKAISILEAMGCKVHISIEEPLNQKFVSVLRVINYEQETQLWKAIRESHEKSVVIGDEKRFITNYINANVSVLVSSPRLVILTIKGENLQLRFDIG